MGYSNILAVLGAVAVASIVMFAYQRDTIDSTKEAATFQQEVYSREIALTGLNVIRQQLAEDTDWNALTATLNDLETAYANGAYRVDTAIYVPGPKPRMKMQIRGATALTNHIIDVEFEQNLGMSPTASDQVSEVMAQCHTFTGNYGYVVEGAGMLGSSNGQIDDFNIPGNSVVYAELVWITRGGSNKENGKNVTLEVDGVAHAISGEMDVEAGNAVYYADVTSLVELGTHDYRLSGLNIGGGDNEGFTIIAVYEDTGMEESDIRFCVGSDYGYFGRVYDKNSELFVFDYGDASGCEDDRVLDFTVVIGDVNDPIRPNALWGQVGLGPLPTTDTDGDGLPDIVWAGNGTRIAPAAGLAPEAVPPHPAAPYGSCASSWLGCMGPVFPKPPYAFHATAGHSSDDDDDDGGDSDDDDDGGWSGDDDDDDGSAFAGAPTYRGARLDIYSTNISLPAMHTWVALQAESVPRGKNYLDANGWRDEDGNSASIGSSFVFGVAAGRLPACEADFAGGGGGGVDMIGYSEWAGKVVPD
ncbi:MAG: hypothetical protein AAF752_01245 [Bacteroidota bacterium]